MVLGSGRTCPQDFLFLVGFFSVGGGGGVDGVTRGMEKDARRSASGFGVCSNDAEGSGSAEAEDGAGEVSGVNKGL